MLSSSVELVLPQSVGMEGRLLTESLPVAFERELRGETVSAKALQNHWGESKIASADRERVGDSILSSLMDSLSCDSDFLKVALASDPSLVSLIENRGVA